MDFTMAAHKHTRRIKTRRGVEDGNSAGMCVGSCIRKKERQISWVMQSCWEGWKSLCVLRNCDAWREVVYTHCYKRKQEARTSHNFKPWDDISYLKSPISVHCIKRSFIYMRTTYERDDKASAAASQERRNCFLFSGGCLDDSNTMVMLKQRWEVSFSYLNSNKEAKEEEKHRASVRTTQKTRKKGEKMQFNLG